MKMTTMPRRTDGQILNCKYGYQWPLSQYTTGYVQIQLRTTRKGKVRANYVWAATRAELLAK
jgi:hypothetical protein